MKWMHHTGETRYADRLQDFVRAKNNRLNRALGMRAPADISFDNQAEAYKSLFKLKRRSEPELKIGDLVTIAPERLPFCKNYDGYFDEKPYEVIRKTDYKGIKRYSLKDLAENAEISGSYNYAELLQKKE